MLIERLDSHPKQWLRLTILWMIFIIILSTPLFTPQNSAKYKDKITTEINFRFIAHLVVYFILGFLLSGAVRLNFNWKKKLVMSIAICVLYSIFDELHQYFEPGRSLRLIDIATNIFGSLFGIFGHYLVFLRLKRKEREGKITLNMQ